MNTTLLPLAPLLTSILTGIVIFCLGERHAALRTALNLLGATLNLVLVGLMLWLIYLEHDLGLEYPLVPGLVLQLRPDALSALFVALSALLWLLTTLYAVGYLRHGAHRSRFFGFFSFCVAATMGLAMADNLPTFFIFYELLTLSTWPLVVHRGDANSLRSGALYLRYALCAGAAILLGIVWLQSLVGAQSFTEGGYLRPFIEGNEAALTMIFGLLVLGFGVKAALVPLHGWLPRSMVAPAPVSALLHAVAVVKAGAFGIVRVVYDVFGIQAATLLGVLPLLATLAAITILYGSFQALRQDDIKARLAYSTVSQVSYITLGIAIGGTGAAIGGIAHLVHQGIMKITLFFCAGSYAETLGVKRISQLDGIGRRMPLTTLAFTIGALGMIGIPPIAGFISKWYLASGSTEAMMPWVLIVLLGSTLLNAAYFLPLLGRAWFTGAERQWPAASGRWECHPLLLTPALVTALLAILAGLLASAPFSPLQWATLIAERELR